MARGGKSSSSRSSSRPVSAPKKTTPTNSNQNVAKPSMLGGIGGALMTGMAFGAGAELMRGLFRGESGAILPLLISGGISYAAYKVSSNNVKLNKYRIPIGAATFFVTFMYMSRRSEENQYEH